MEMVSRNVVQRLCIPFAKVEVREAMTVRCLPRHTQHRARQVDAQHGSPGADPRCSAKRGFAAAGREIEHVHAWLEAREVEHALAQRGRQAGLDSVIPTPDVFEREQR